MTKSGGRTGLRRVEGSRNHVEFVGCEDNRLYDVMTLITVI